MNKTIAIIPLVTLTSLSLALSLPSKAQAVEVNISPRGVDFNVNNRNYRDYYSVYYRKPHQDRWRLAGTYRDRYEAERVENGLRRNGYIARTDRNRG